MYKTTLHAPKPLEPHYVYELHEHTIKSVLREMSDALRAHHELEKRYAKDWHMDADLEHLTADLRRLTDRIQKRNEKLAAKLNVKRS